MPVAVNAPALQKRPVQDSGSKWYLAPESNQERGRGHGGDQCRAAPSNARTGGSSGEGASKDLTGWGGRGRVQTVQGHTAMCSRSLSVQEDEQERRVGSRSSTGEWGKGGGQIWRGGNKAKAWGRLFGYWCSLLSLLCSLCPLVPNPKQSQPFLAGINWVSWVFFARISRSYVC